MRTETGKATAGGSVAKPTQNAFLLANKTYQTYSDKSSLKSIDRQVKIAERLAAMPKKYRAVYKRAVKGKSLRSAVNAQCLECCYWQSKEVTLCTDLACPLWAVRPYRSSGSGHDVGFTGVEPQKSCRGEDYAG